MCQQNPNVDSLFLAASAIESNADRAAWLNQACGDDEALRKQVEQLLQSDQEAGSFLEKPPIGLEVTVAPNAFGKSRAASLDAGLATAFAADQAVVLGDQNHSVLRMLANSTKIPRVSLREPVAETAGPIERPKSAEIPHQQPDSRYRLDGEIARGGMGAILKGRDTDLGRDLAIKVLLDAHKDNPQVIQRFIEEAQIGGQLQHPGIAPVYELGQFADQRPFFSMKLVKGETLSKLLATRKDATDERGKFIGIFEQVCQTMAYAHSRGVIHRDLKPANIMVGAFGEVQVIDWGLAKVLQSGGVADEKKAKQLLQGQSIIQTMRSRGSDVPGSIGSAGTDTQMGSVMGTPAYMPPEQALGEIDRLDERSDVFGLGAILCEILTGKPPYVADDGTQVFRMASRGNLEGELARLADCGADAELITLAKDGLEVEPAHRPKDAGVLAERVTGYLESVETKLRKTEMAKVDAQVRAEELSRRNKLAFTAGAAIVATLVVGISFSAWQAVRATNAERLAKAEATRATTAEQQTAETLAEVAAERDAKELARKDAEDISMFLGEVFQSPDPTRDGREIKVVELLDTAAKKLETELSDQPAQRAKLQETLGGTYYALGLYQQAIPLQEQVRNYYLAASGPEHSATLAAMGKLANSYYFAVRRDEALQLREEALTLSRKTLGPEHRVTLTAMGNVAVSWIAAGRMDEALKMQEAELPLSRKVRGPEHSGTIGVMQNLASSYYSAGRRDEALQLREEVLTLSRKVLGPEDPRTLMAMSNLAISYNDVAGRRDEAQPLREEVLTLSRKVLGPEHRETLGRMTNLAASYREAGRLTDAVTLQEQSLAIKRRVLPPNDPYLGAAINNMASLYWKTDRRDEAIQLTAELLAMRPDDLTPHYLVRRLVTSPDSEGHYPQAKQAVVWARRANELTPNNSGLLTTLGLALYRAKQWQESIDVLQQLMEHGDDRPQTWLFIAMGYWHLDQKDKAQEWYDKSLAWKSSLLRIASPPNAELQGFFAEAAMLMDPAEGTQEIPEEYNRVGGDLPPK